MAERGFMDKRTLLAVALALGIYYVWWWAFGPTPPPAGGADTGAVAEVEAPPEAPLEPVAPQAQPEPTMAQDLPLVELDYAACGFESQVSSRGGGLHSLILDEHESPYDVLPLWKWGYQQITGPRGPWKPYGDPPGPAQLASDEATFLAVGTGDLDSAFPMLEVVEQSPERITLRGVTAEGIELTRVWSSVPHEQGPGCLVDVSTTWRNLGQGPFTGKLWLASHDVLPEKSSRYSPTSRPVAYMGDDFESFDKIHKLEEPEPREGEVSYVGLADGYFAAVYLLDAGDPGQVWFTPREHGEATAYGSHLVFDTTLAVGERFEEHAQLLVRPKNRDELRKLRPELGELVQLGFFGFFARILLWLLNTFHGLVGNWGLAIMTMTLVVKGLFFPLTQMSFKSSQRMQAVQPQLQKLREELKENPEELNRRTMEIFKKEGVNPLGGCLPMLIQMPVWFALYSVLLSSVDLYHTEFLYLRDLSVADPYMVLPTIVVALMLVQQRFMPTGNMDPAQARMMKMMPLIFGFFFFTFPSGLVLYIFVNMVLTILQQWYIKRRFGKPTAPAPA